MCLHKISSGKARTFQMRRWVSALPSLPVLSSTRKDGPRHFQLYLGDSDYWGYQSESFNQKRHRGRYSSSVQFNSVTQACLTFCNPTDYSMPSLPVHHHLLELAQTHVQWCHPTISSSVDSFSRLQSFPASGSFPISQFFSSGGQSIGASVLPMNIQDWFSLGWSGWISLQSKGLSRVFSKTTVQKHPFFCAQLSLWSNSI